MIWLILGLLGLPSFLALSNDPAPGLLTSIEDSRRLICERASIEEVRRIHPGLLDDGYPRGDFIERNAVLCEEDVIAERHPRDMAILDGLSATTSALASRVAALKGKTGDRNWLVEVHYPNTSALPKLTFAAKAALRENGLKVTDRLPTLAVGDIQVLARTPPMQAYALACKRYFANDKLGADDAVLSLLLLDSRETILHAGICLDGRWTWLQ